MLVVNTEKELYEYNTGTQMKKFKLDDMKGGWFVGNFEPSVMKADFEVGIPQTQKESSTIIFTKGTEINVMRKGKIKLNGEIFEPVIFLYYIPMKLPPQNI